MRVRTLNEEMISGIGRAFGDYDYGAEKSLVNAFPSRDAAAAYICGYVRMALQSGMLYATSERGEGFIAYKLPGERIGLRAGLLLAGAALRAMPLRSLVCFIRSAAGGEPGLQKRMDREKKPYLHVGLVCVRKSFQGQGYMRRVMDMAFAEGDRLQLPVILETDAQSKCDKYLHLGMELAGIRDFGELGKMYDLIRYPAKP